LCDFFRPPMPVSRDSDTQGSRRLQVLFRQPNLFFPTPILRALRFLQYFPPLLTYSPPIVSTPLVLSCTEMGLCQCEYRPGPLDDLRRAAWFFFFNVRSSTILHTRACVFFGLCHGHRASSGVRRYDSFARRTPHLPPSPRAFA